MARVNVRLDGMNAMAVSSIAKSEEKSVRAFVNEWLTVAATLSNEGWTVKKLETLCNSFTLMKEVDAVTLPSDFVDELIAREFKTDKQGLFKMFRQMGSQIADVVKIDSPNIGDVANVANEFLPLLPLKLFNISPDATGGTLEIQIVGAGRRIESTECAFQTLKGFLDSYGFSVTSSQISVGTLRVRASRIQSGIPSSVN